MTSALLGVFCIVEVSRGTNWAGFATHRPRLEWGRAIARTARDIFQQRPWWGLPTAYWRDHRAGKTGPRPFDYGEIHPAHSARTAQQMRTLRARSAVSDWRNGLSRNAKSKFLGQLPAPHVQKDFTERIVQNDVNAFMHSGHPAPFPIALCQRAVGAVYAQLACSFKSKPQEPKHQVFSTKII